MTERRNTSQRKWILEVIDRQGHVSPADIIDALRSSHPEVSISTIYRNLGILLEEDRISLVGPIRQKELYDIRTDQHAHRVCTRCGQIRDLAGPDDRPSAFMSDEGPTDPDGFLVLQTSVFQYGICQECQMKERQTTPTAERRT